MPYTVRDVDRHIKGLSAKQKRAWVQIANSVLESCTGDEKTCAATAIRQANGAAQRIKEALELFEAADSDAFDLLDVSEAILRRSASDDGIRQAVQSALRAKFTADPGSGYPSLYPWTRDVFHTDNTSGQVVYELDGSCYQADFSLSTDAEGDYAAEIGDGVEVDIAYIPMSDAREGAQPALIAGEFTELVERAVKPDGSTLIKIIQPGWGSSGYYGRDVLERDGPKVFRTGHRMFWNHPTPQEDKARPERDLRDLAAVLQEDAQWKTHGPKGPGLYATARVLGPYQKSVEELAPYMGVSIRGVGLTEDGEAEGKRGKIVKSLVHSRSVDFVTAAGAGGEVLNLFESARDRAYELPRPADDSPANTPGEPVREGSTSMPLTKEERDAIVADISEALRPVIEASNVAATTALARITEAQRLNEARGMAATVLAPVRLPNETKMRIVEAVSLNPPIKDGAIDREAYTVAIKEAAKAEARYISSITGGSTIYGAGSGDDVFESAGSDLASDEHFQENMTGLFGMMGMSESAAKQAAIGRVI